MTEEAPAKRAEAYGVSYRAEIHEHPDTGMKSLVYVPECCRGRYESLRVMGWAHAGGCTGSGATDRALEQMTANPPDPARIPPAELLDGLPPQAEAFFQLHFEKWWDKHCYRRAARLTQDWSPADARLFEQRLADRLPRRIRWPDPRLKP